MSGIAGIYRFDDAPVELEQLRAMTAGMRHRGPDAEGHWAEGGIGLGQCALHTTPESLHEDQPIRRGDYILVSDARLDHREDLLGALGLRSTEDHILTDADLILAAFEKWGDDCVHHLRGDFTFAIWNRRTRRLFCARDHFGVRPFYYHRSARFFAFASDIGALLALEEVPRSIDESRIADYLIGELEGVDGVCTFYQGLLRMPPAHRVELLDRSVRVERYWSVTAPSELQLGGDAEYQEAFLEFFTRSVRSRLRGIGPPASMLSGGLDSSSVVGVARELVQEAPLKTFSAITRRDDCLESRCATAVIAQGLVEAHTVLPEQLRAYSSAWETVESVCRSPFDFNIAHVPLTMYAAAKDAGCKYLLDGVPGDLLLDLGSNYLTLLFSSLALSDVYREARGARAFYGAEVDPPLGALVRHGLRAVPLLRSIKRLALGRAGVRQAVRNAPIEPSFGRSSGVSKRLLGMRAEGALINEPISKSQARQLRQPWLTAGVERYGRVAAALSIEPRHPFLDLHLVEFCLSLPWQQKMQGGRTKGILRQAMQGRLPEEVIWRRTRTHVGPCFSRAWVELRARRMGRVAAGQSEVSRYLRCRALREALASLQRGDPAEQEIWRLIQGLALDAWWKGSSSDLDAIGCARP